MKTTNELSRRGFLVACGATAAATAIPAAAFEGETWAGMRGQAPAMRAAYMAEIARLAETLRPRFEAGELRACRDEDDYEDNDPENMPMGRCEAAVAKHFGLEVAVTDESDHSRVYEGDEEAAYVVLACSPHAAATDHGHNHPCYHAQTAAAWDLIAAARSRGIYAPTADEESLPSA